MDFTNVKSLNIEHQPVMRLMLNGQLIWQKASDEWGGLCFTAELAGSTIAMNKNGTAPEVSLMTSPDGKTWTSWDGSVKTFANVGDKLYVKANGSNPSMGTDNNNYNQLLAIGAVAASGNIMSLLDETMQSTTVPDYGFKSMFSGSDITTTPDLSKVKQWGSNSARGMFYNTTTLRHASNFSTPLTDSNGNAFNLMYENCANLTGDVNLGGMPLIPERMFKDCPSLESVTAPQATSIGVSAFWRDYGLKSVAVSPQLSVLGDAAFSVCSSLTDFSNANILTVGNQCFSTALKLSNMNINETVVSCGYSAFISCDSITQANWPKLKAINISTFQHCVGLTAFNAPSLTTMNSGWNFSGCDSLVSVYIPACNTLTSGAFNNCSKLKVIDFGSTRTTATALRSTSSTFAGLPSDYKILVPHDIWTTWRSATNWASSAIQPHIFIRDVKPTRDITSYDSEVEYLQSASSKNCVIDSESYMNKNNSYTIKYQFTTAKENAFNSLFGYELGNERFFARRAPNSTSVRVYGTGDSYESDTDVHEITFNLRNMTMTKDGEVTDLTSEAKTPTGVASITYALFGIKYLINDNYPPDSQSISLKMFSFIERDENDNIIHEFVPVRFTNENGNTEGGMYDKNTGKVHTNRRYGNFIIGPDKNN